MMWSVFFGEEFAEEFEHLHPQVKIELRAMVRLLQARGPQLGRPWADTLNGSIFANMKELRFNAVDGVWRVAFAFDPLRNAIILVAGDKSGVSEKNFYSRLIRMADKRYQAHLDTMKRKGDK